MLFRPFRLGLWARLGVVAIVTGEAGLGVGSSTGGMPNLNRNPGGEDQWTSQGFRQSLSHGIGAAHFFSEPGWEQIRPYLGWIAVGVGLVFAGVLLWIYSDCVYRFILLDTLVTGQCRLRDGWRRWRVAGRRYFVWVVSFGFGALLLSGTVVGIPILMAYRTGWFEKPEDNLGALIGWGILLALVLVVLVAGFSGARNGLRRTRSCGRLAQVAADVRRGQARVRRLRIDEDCAGDGQRDRLHDC
jgi:hypothetical protein